MREVVIFLLFFCLISLGCNKDQKGDLEDIPYMPSPYQIRVPDGFPSMPIPPDNPTTAEGVDLGRRLFYDELLSDDFTMSCSSCHLPEGNFTDNEALSKGIDGIEGRRSSMSLLNIGFAGNGLFWDGRAASLEEQALAPVEDTLELHTTWPIVVERVQKHPTYPELFRRAFGINDSDEITKELIAKALAQFERTLVTSGDAKYDRWIRNEVEFSDEEFLGYVLFFDLDPDIKDAECGHCHNAPLFNTDEYFNNGIEPIKDISDFPDRGRAEVTNDEFDTGRFRAPTLRNIVFSAPYMHDGRFETLEQVVDHYNSGGHFQANKDPLIRPLRLLDHEKEALISFIHTLTDSTFIETPMFQDPD